MLVIPAIDIIGKKVVRLTQGDFKREKVYSDDPVEIAKRWQKEGAELIHVIDLDGARTGEPKNLDVISKIIEAVDIPIQLGGGLRTEKAIAGAIDIGVSRVIIGTKAATDINFTKEMIEKYGEKIAASIDAIGLGVMAAGWGEEVPKTATELASEIAIAGAKTIIFTNIQIDGTLEGLKEYWVCDMISAAGKTKVIIAGGVSSMDDIVKLKDISMLKENLYGVITGKAIYEGKLNLADAIKTAKER